MKKIFFILILVVLAFQIYSQDATSDNWHDKASAFRLKAIARDLAHADLNQLKSIARSLGLEEAANAEKYRNIIGTYYGIKVPPVSQAKSSEQKIIIERAGELEVIKLEEEDEENLQILGKARLLIESRDEENKLQKRTIEADEIYINTKNKEITGIGNVFFADDRLEYNGKQFYYNYDINRGVLFEGRTKLLKGGESGLEGAFFTGEKVIQTGKDDIILQNGLLTTCKEENPHYNMNVSRLWVSEKGEWGVLNGVFHIGSIPVFYFPVYYHPKELRVSPGFGFKTREGWYFNSTYYFFQEQAEKNKKSQSEKTSKTQQEKKASSGSLSASSLVTKRRNNHPYKITFTSDDVQKKLKKFYEGKEFYEKHPKLKLYPKFTSMDVGLSIFADAYTNIGFYTGVNFFLDLKYKYFPMTIQVMSDYGFARRIWQEDSEFESMYIPYNPEHEGAPYINRLDEDDFDINNNYYFLKANPLLFRSAQWLYMKGSLFKKHIDFNYSVNFEYATDKDFYADFYNRRESFAYLDLLADAISYSVLTQEDQISSFETTGGGTVNSDKSRIESKIHFDIAPRSKSIPTLFELPLIDKVSLKVDSVLSSQSVNINSESQTSTMSLTNKYKNLREDEDYDGPRHFMETEHLNQDYDLKYKDAEDFFAEKFYFDKLTLPEINKFSMSGTLIDYDSILKAPKAYEEYLEKLEQKKEDKAGKGELTENELYFEIRDIKENKPDQKDVDYKILLPFYSKRIKPPEVKQKKAVLTYNTVLIGDEDFSYKEEVAEEEKKVEIPEYDLLPEVAPLSKKEIARISPVNFSLKYSMSDSIKNQFIFDKQLKNDEFLDFDTMTLLLTGNYDFERMVDEFFIDNKFEFNLNGSLTVLKIGNNSIFTMSPRLSISYDKYYNDEEIFRRDQKDDLKYYDLLDSTADAAIKSANIARVEDTIDKNWLSREIRNKTKSGVKITYSDIIINDLSFGNYIIDGTKITTSISMNLFSYNEYMPDIFNDLNYLNRNDNNYNAIDFFQFNSIIPIYERISKLETRFNLSFNIFPKGSDHTLKMGLSSTIKWIPHLSQLSIIKSSIWNTAQNDIVYTGLNESGYSVTHTKEAQNLMYYLDFENNLENKLIEFYTEDFWSGPNYFREMFQDVSYNFNYNYKRGDKTIVSITDSLIFRLTNIGRFSEIDGSVKPGVYPDNVFTISFFNSILTYSTNIKFKKLNFPLVNPFNDPDKNKSDDYKIMTMTNSHSLKLSLPFSLFKLDFSGNLIDFDTRVNLVWDRSKVVKNEDTWQFNSTWNDKSEFNYFYLDTQSISLGLFKGIVKLSLDFIHHNFNETGYGIMLKSGSISIGNKIDMIPVFLRYFKLELTPIAKFNFVVNHPEIVTNFTTGNILSLSFDASLIIGKGEFFETTIKFSLANENKQMYRYYPETVDDFAAKSQDFFTDLGNSFAFDDISKRIESPFNIRRVEISIDHKLCDWEFSFSYIGESGKSQDQINWENTFEFAVKWNLDTENQLMKMFNKTKVDAKYNNKDAGNYTGRWQQPVLSLDPDKVD